MFWYACYSNAAFLISTASEKKKKTGQLMSLGKINQCLMSCVVYFRSL